MTQAQKAKPAEAKAAEEAKVAEEAKAAGEAKAAEEAKASGLDMVAINTIGNHKPGDKFKAKDKAAFDRFISLGAAKRA